jgi:hypothetical protein
MMAELSTDDQIEFLQEQITKYDTKTEESNTEDKKDF